MRIQFSFVGQARMERSEQGEGDLWVEMDAVPQEGDEVHVPGVNAATVVRTVVWYPLGDDAASEGLSPSPDDRTEPFVYVVLGERRPGS